VRTFCRILYLWQGWMETWNLPAFPTLRDFLDRHNKNRPSGPQVTIMQNMENLSVQFVLHCSWQKNLIVEASGLFHCVVWIVSLMLKSHMIFQKIWLTWWQTTGFRPFSRKCPLNEVQLCGFSYHLDKHTCVISFFGYGIHQDQIEKLYAAEIGHDTCCQ